MIKYKYFKNKRKKHCDYCGIPARFISCSILKPEMICWECMAREIDHEIQVLQRIKKGLLNEYFKDPSSIRSIVFHYEDNPDEDDKPIF